MREIKFRSWDKLAKKMSNSYNLQRQPTFNSEHNGKFCISTISPSGWLGFDGFSENERQIAMQYTGLKDKNEVEIYEGDICRCWGGSEFNGYYEYNKIYEVKWQGSGFEMMIDDCGYGWNYSSGFEYIEIIGNIYENKELLN